jgi:hypothetical protein
MHHYKTHKKLSKNLKNHLKTLKNYCKNLQKTHIISAIIQKVIAFCKNIKINVDIAIRKGEQLIVDD